MNHTCAELYTLRVLAPKCYSWYCVAAAFHIWRETTSRLPINFIWWCFINAVKFFVIGFFFKFILSKKTTKNVSLVNQQIRILMRYHRKQQHSVIYRLKIALFSVSFILKWIQGFSIKWTMQTRVLSWQNVDRKGWLPFLNVQVKLVGVIFKTKHYKKPVLKNTIVKRKSAHQ